MFSLLVDYINDRVVVDVLFGLFFDIFTLCESCCQHVYLLLCLNPLSCWVCCVMFGSVMVVSGVCLARGVDVVCLVAFWLCCDSWGLCVVHHVLVYCVGASVVDVVRSCAQLVLCVRGVLLICVSCIEFVGCWFAVPFLCVGVCWHCVTGLPPLSFHVWRCTRFDCWCVCVCCCCSIVS